MIRALLATDTSLEALVIRVTLGAVMLPHGLQKLLGWFGGAGFGHTLEAFQQWFGLPAAVTVLVILAESVGSLCLILGLLTRISAASIGAVMLGAIYFVTGRWGFFMNWYSQERGEGYEFHLLVLGMVVMLLISGGGRWSLDGALRRRLGD